jgi:hypothetical protein
MSQRFVDEQRKLRLPTDPDDVSGDQPEPPNPPHNPPGAVFGLATELHRQVMKALDAEVGDSLERGGTHELAERIMRNSHQELIAAFLQLPQRGAPATEKLRDDPNLVVQMKLPHDIRQPRTVTVRVGDGCANYLGRTNAGQFRKAVRGFLNNLRG